MRKFITVLMMLFLIANLSFSQSTSMVFYYGATPDSMYLWPWGFTLDPEDAPKAGYTPGTSALRWVTSANDGWQGCFIGLNSNVGNDLTSIWETDSVYFKLRAPNGLAETDTLILFLYDSRNSDWEYTVYKNIDNFHDIQDGYWHQFSMALKDLVPFNNPIDKSDIVAVSFETPQEGAGIESEFYIDHVWIGNPDLSVSMTLWNGQSVMPGVTFEAWGFENNDLVLAEGEGFLEGTPAILWETANWEWQGKGFYFDPQDLTYSWTVDSTKIKIKAPAGINDLVLIWYDWNDYAARKVLDDVAWDGTWQSLAIALTDFTTDEGFDPSTVYYFSIEANSTTIPERVLIDDIWLGTPSVSIDIVPPPAPENVMVDVSLKYVNLIAWDNIGSETGETYDVYASMSPITDLESEGVNKVASKVPEGEVAVHNIYYPLENGSVSYYYAVTCMDAAGNPSETFGTMAQPATNTGKKRAIISLTPPANFVADGDLSEWDHIVPFMMNPDSGNLYTGEINDELDYSANVYVAMDNENLYVAFDVFDDVFSWTENNTSDWWEDEGIEFFIGLYDFTSHHLFFYRGAEPDYRLLILPDRIELWNGDSILTGTDNYIFEPLGNADYIIEARIPFASIQVEGDSVFTPEQGMTIPFEIFAGDADVPDGGNESRLQLGDNAALNPWWDGPRVWTFAWVGMPLFTDVAQPGENIVRTWYLGENYPNPFNPSTTIEYAIAQSGMVELDVYNALGQRVTTLVSKHQPAGTYSITFDASDLASGIYYYKIRSKEFSQVRKMLLVK